MRNIIKISPVVVALTACTSQVYSPPITSYEPVSCESVPDLSAAVSLTSEKKKKMFSVTQLLDQSASCILVEAQARPYVLFELPDVSENKMIEVGSAIEPSRVVPTDVSTLDENGNVVRGFAPERFKFRGAMLSAQMLPQEGEKYLMVTVNPAQVGENYNAIETSTSTTSIYTGYGVSNWTSGVDQHRTRGFSYEGSIVAIVYDRTK